MSVSIHGTGTITGIDQGIQISGVSTFINSVSIGGTLTYEDVTNIDSIGIITARSGIIGDLTGNVTGNVTGDITGNIGGTTTIAGISSSIADTAVAVFVYDTSKDSDGGAWRKRTQHTSWYNETLNTQYRGSRREFPAVAVIVAEEFDITIYDADDPDLPMWMLLRRNGWDRLAHYSRADDTSIGYESLAALNGIICVGSYQDESCLQVANFLADKSEIYRATGNIYSHGYSNGLVGDTGGAGGGNIFDGTSTGLGLSNSSVYDIAMTVASTAPIDDVTGLPVPTIAVATDTGICVITDSGSVYDLTTSDAYDNYRKVEFGDNNRLYYTGDDTQVLYSRAIPTADQDYTAYNTTNTNRVMFPTMDHGGFPTNHPVRILGTNGGDNPLLIAKNKAVGSNETSYSTTLYPASPGLTFLDEGPTNPTSAVAYVTTSYNTGWLYGDIKGAFLSSTDATDLVQGDILGGNGTFDDASYWTVGSSWTVSGGVATSDSSGISYLTKNGILTAENRYVIKLTISSYSAGTLYVYCGTGAPGTKNYYYGLSSNGTHTMILDAYNTNFGLYGSNFGGVVDNLTISSAVDENHCWNIRDIGVIGTVARNPVATGADLVEYGPFTTTDHLRQPYHPDHSHMELGTGDAYEMIWYKTTNTSPYMMLMSYEGAAYGTTDYGKPFNIRMESGKITAYASHNSFSNYDWYQHPSSTNDGYWHCAAWVRRGQVFELYSDGTLSGTDSGAVGSNALSDSNSELVIGGRKRGLAPGTCEEPFFGSLALARIGKSAPTAEEIKKMYLDELSLFQENAKATLYGSSDAVTALAYDDYTNILHVGTSSGRSDFQRLRRINNTTTAVTTAISASDDLIVEQ